MAKIKFEFLPFTWGMKGKTRAIAKAEYELSGYELKKALLDIRADELPDIDHKAKSADLLFEFGKITKFEHLRMLVDLIPDEKQKALAVLELDFKEGIMSEIQYQKQSATLRGDPWVTVLSMNFGGAQSLEGSFELDWNELFVDKLQADGYVGSSPDHIVNQWFMEICRNVALEEFDGTGDFTADSAANLEAVKRWGSSTEMSNGRKGYQ